jgi:hypothetical protein
MALVIFAIEVTALFLSLIYFSVAAKFLWGMTLRALGVA